MLGRLRRRREEWSLSNELPDGWYRVPIEADLATLDDEMREWVEFVHEQPGMVHAFLYRSDPDDNPGAEALLTMTVAPAPLELSLRAWVEQHLGGGVGEITEERLPVGRAVRVHRTGERDADDPTGTVAEGVGFAFRAPDGDVVWQELAWEGYGDHRFCDAADRIAAGLTFT